MERGGAGRETGNGVLRGGAGPLAWVLLFPRQRLAIGRQWNPRGSGHMSAVTLGSHPVIPKENQVNGCLELWHCHRPAQRRPAELGLPAQVRHIPEQPSEAPKWAHTWGNLQV